MQLIPNNPEIKRRQSMHHVSAQTSAGNEYYSLQEKAYGHLVIRTSAENKSVPKAIKSLTDLDLPATLSTNQNKQYSISWISPDEFLLLAPEKTEFDVEQKLRKLMTGHYAIINVTGGQTVLKLSGARAETIIKKSSSYDIHQSNFPIGKVVTTIFAKSQLILKRTGDDSFQLIIRRSFSDYLWRWIVDAGSRV